MMKKLVELLLLSQEELLAYIDAIYAPMYEKEVFEGGLVFKPKDVEMYPLMCTHLDTINTHRKYKLTKEDIVLFDKDIKLDKASKASCLGGDDRCGVYIALELMAKGLPYAFGFFLDEEIGGKGSDNYSTIIDTTNITALVGLDRKGSNDVALYGYDNSELTEIFVKQGYKVAMGTFTDASNLAGVCGLACVNLSIGYYNEHTPQEYIVFGEVEDTLKTFQKLSVIASLAEKQYISENTQTLDPLYTYVDIANFPIVAIEGEEFYIEAFPNKIRHQEKTGEYLLYNIAGRVEQYLSINELLEDLTLDLWGTYPIVIDSSRKLYN